VPKPAGFEATFKTLRALLKPYERHFTVIVDKPHAYYLATKTSRTVSFHLIPVYAAPALLKGVSPPLLKRMQGKSCFTFTAIEPAHVKELEALTKKGFDGFIKKFP
jgi:hypothetical protein